MKIAYLCPNYQDQRGGAEVMAYHLSEELQKRGHHVDIFAAQTSDKPVASNVRLFKRWEWVESIAGWILSLEQRRGFYRLIQAIRRDGLIPLLARGPFCPAIRKARYYRGYDVVVLVGFGSGWEWLLHHAKRRFSNAFLIGVPLFHVHEDTASRRIHDRVRMAFDCIVTLTEFEKSFLVRRGWAKDRIVAIGVGSETACEAVSDVAFREQHGIERDAPLILFLGRKIYNKGVVHVVQAMDLVWGVFPEAKLALIGFPHNSKGWLKGHLEQCRADAASRVVDIDNATEQEKENALAACTLMVLPSISDSFGIVYLDAWRHRKPVVGCRNTCCESFIIPGVNGQLVSFGDVAGLGKVLIDFLNNPIRAHEMGEAGYSLWRDRYRWSKIAEESELLYTQVAISSP